MLAHIQQKASKLDGMCEPLCEEGLRDLGLFSQVERSQTHNFERQLDQILNVLTSDSSFMHRITVYVYIIQQLRNRVNNTWYCVFLLAGSALLILFFVS